MIDAAYNKLQGDGEEIMCSWRGNLQGSRVIMGLSFFINRRRMEVQELLSVSLELGP